MSDEDAIRLAAEEETVKKAAEEEAAKKIAEEQAVKRAAEEEAAKKAAEKEVAKKAAEEEAAKKAAEEEAAKKIAEEEAAKKIAEEEAVRKATEDRKTKELLEKKKNEEAKNNLKFCMADNELLLKVLHALEFKGGSSSVSSLTVALMLEEAVIMEGIKTGEILELITFEEDEYALTSNGEKILSISSVDQKNLLGTQLLAVEAYRDIIFRMKMAPNQDMQEKEIDKAFYILIPQLREEIRKQIASSFLNLAHSANLIESSLKTGVSSWRITSNGEKLLGDILAAKKTKRKGGVTVGGGIQSSKMASDLACNSCGKPIMAEFKLCPYCGTALVRSCKNCGKQLEPGWKMCPFCGSTN